MNPQAYWKLGLFDYFCGAFALLALILCIVTREPLLATIFALIADVLATIPTITKTYTHPETESAFTYVATIIGSISSLMILQTWDFTAYAFPVWFIAMCTIIVALIGYHHFF